MSDTAVDPDTLRRLLHDATGQETIRQLMTVIAVAEGDDPEEVADRYGFAPGSVEEWVAAFEAEPPERVVERLERFGTVGRRITPTGQESESHVEYLDYDAVVDRGWDLSDPDLFEKARASDLDAPDYGGFEVPGGDSVLEGAEAAGIDWPHACRGGACSNCAVLVTSGELSMPGNHVLPEEAIERGARLGCVGTPVTDRVTLVYNVDDLDYLRDFRLETPT